jgi:hypothetical protein
MRTFPYRCYLVVEWDLARWERTPKYKRARVAAKCIKISKAHIGMSLAPQMLKLRNKLVPLVEKQRVSIISKKFSTGLFFLLLFFSF